jgi:hypothetical protein
MKSDLIKSHRYSCAYHSSWWTASEFAVLCTALKNFPFTLSDPIAFHSKTGIMTKSTNEIISFCAHFRHLCLDREKGVFVIPPRLQRIQEAPDCLKNWKGFWNWGNLSVKECEKVKDRIVLIEGVRRRLASDIVEYDGSFNVTKYLGLILEFGLDLRVQILADKRFGFHELLSVNDFKYASGEVSRRNLYGVSDVPEWIWKERDMHKFLERGGDDNDEGDRYGIVRFAMPSTSKLRFGPEVREFVRKKSRKDKVYGNVDDEYT